MDDIPLSWAREVMKLSLSATALTASGVLTAGKPPQNPGRDPRLRKLLEAVLFSRRFILTYHFVALGILLVFTIWHWSEKVVLAKRRRDLGRVANSHTGEVDEAWSSSSSTLEGTGTPPDQAKKLSSVETTPLLATRAAEPQSIRPIWRPYYSFKAFLQYQPAPIPIINKSLPPNSVSLFVLAFLGLNLFYNLYNIPPSMFYLFPFADRCGLLFVSNLPLLYLLSAKNQPIKFLTGHSYEALNIFHRRLGELLCFEAFLHFLCMSMVWYGMLRPRGMTIAQFLFNTTVVFGIGAFVAYEVLYFTSLGSFRKRWYEWFLATHIFLQIAGLALLFFHHRMSRPYVAISLAIFVVDRLVYRMVLKSSTHTATLTALEDGETLLLSSNWDVRNKNAIVPANMNNGWAPNSHIFLTIPSLSKTGSLQTHPFTIFSAAPSSEPQNSDSNQQHAWFSLLIRAQARDGFTHDLLTYAQTHPNNSSIRIRLDGPYGSSHALDLLESSSNAIIVAGGSGIAVAYPLLYALLCPSNHPNNNQTELGLATTASKANREVKLVWITHSRSHRDWLPEDKLKELEEWGLMTVMPAPTSEAGRPDLWILKTLVVGEYAGRGGSGRTGVVVSGPEGLVRDVRNMCAGMVAEGVDVKVQVEKFGW